MPAKAKYQVFISSTYSDLREEREAVTWAILKARHIPAGMENFTAAYDRGWQVIKAVIDRSDYYVLIVAGRYGSLDKDGMSWTEREYLYAIEREVPVLAFIRSRTSITADKMDTEPALQLRLEEFTKRVRKNHLCDEWSSKDELAAKVAAALRNHIDDDERDNRARPGWYRGDEIPSERTLEEFARLSVENQTLRGQVADGVVAELQKRVGEIVTVHVYQAGYTGVRLTREGRIIACNQFFFTIEEESANKHSFSVDNISLSMLHNPDKLLIQVRMN